MSTPAGPHDHDEDANILDQIEEVLDQHEEPLVPSYVAKGGQGISDVFTSEFFVGAVSGGVAGNAAYDLIKAAVFRTMASFREWLPPGGGLAQRPTLTLPPEGSVWDLINDDGSFVSPDDEQRLKAIYDMVVSLPTDLPPGHSPEEAHAVHYLAFFQELFRRASMVQLLPRHHEKLQQAAQNASVPMPLSQLVAHIIEEWLRRNPSADRGIFNV